MQSGMNLSQDMDSLQRRMEPLERFLQLLASSLPSPSLRKFDVTGQGFRYSNPDIRHFCLLKAVRAVSAFNAAIALCHSGYTQEISVLLRTVVECTSHIDFVLSKEPSDEDVSKFMEQYFSDVDRSSGKFKKSHLRQGDIHNSIGESLGRVMETVDDGGEYSGVDASKLYSKVYLTLSNYVHCKYPETMDLYGGIPGRFHLRGMRGTPKDAENIEVLESYFVSVSQCLHMMALKLNVKEQAQNDLVLAEWMKTNLV